MLTLPIWLAILAPICTGILGFLWGVAERKQPNVPTTIDIDRND